MNQTKVHKEDSVTIAGTGKKTLEVFSRKNLHYIILKVTKNGTAATVAQMKAQVTDLVVRIDGKAFHEADATFFLDIERYYKDGIVSGGNANIAGYIKIPFVRTDLPAAASRMATSLGIKGVEKIIVEVQIAATTNIDLIEIFSVYDDGAPRAMGVTRRFSKHNHAYATTGVDQIPDLPFKDSGVIGWLAAHIKYSSGTLDEVSVIKNSTDELNETPPAVLQTLAQDNQRAPQSGYVHVDFGKDRDPLMFLDMPAESLLIKPKWSSAAPNDYNIYLERLFADPAK